MSKSPESLYVNPSPIESDLRGLVLGILSESIQICSLERGSFSSNTSSKPSKFVFVVALFD